MRSASVNGGSTGVIGVAVGIAGAALTGPDGCLSVGIRIGGAVGSNVGKIGAALTGPDGCLSVGIWIGGGVGSNVGKIGAALTGPDGCLSVGIQIGGAVGSNVGKMGAVLPLEGVADGACVAADVATFAADLSDKPPGVTVFELAATPPDSIPLHPRVTAKRTMSQNTHFIVILLSSLSN